ncbi:MAG: DNA sulfur modification protein DndD [Candidatus Rokubacteria bacterium]|nr:DNA sulfur modification protein DndD [Candidatus Rokubacteria bacterium]
MILTRLTVTDFGVFRGRQTIALAPRPSRPVVLFGGKNGAGKTTLLEAVRLCLYGSGALGARTSKEAYLAYLEGRIHSNPDFLIQPMFASVSVEFQHADVGAVHTYTVTRSWERKGANRIVEHLDLERDGKALDELAGEHWQEFVRELVPPGVAQLFFFDGEKIQQLAEDSSDQRTLADAIKSLLGLNLVERLQTDLNIFQSRLTLSAEEGEPERELYDLERDKKALEDRLRTLMGLRSEQEAHLEDLRGRIARIEAKISGEGGAFARGRETLVRQQAELKGRINENESTLRQICAGLLPFALAPRLCAAVRTQLLTEEALVRRAASREILATVRQELVVRLAADDLWQPLSCAPYAAIHELQERLVDKVREPFAVEREQEGSPVHELSPGIQRQVLNWIDQTGEVGRTGRAIGDDLERLYRELQRVEDGLRKIPADDVLKPLLKELHDAHTVFADAARRATEQEEEIKSAELALDEAERRSAKASERLIEERGEAAKIRMIPRIHKVLGEYQSRLIDRKVVELQAAVSESFNALCRKKDALRKIVIDPMTFGVTLYDRQTRPLPKAQLSAGEKQIYAIAMLWALAKTSGRALPVIIDTPLARLDSDHRSLMLRQYFPRASHQVLILSTDTEVDQAYFAELRPKIAHAYHLEFDVSGNSTTITPGYFWKSGSHETH